MPGFPAEDLSGRVFGRWLVLRRTVGAPKGGTMWLCRCDPQHGGCGTERAVSAGHLKGGRSKSCSKCAAFQRHKDDPGAYRVPRRKVKVWKPACGTCGERFRGFTYQRYCAPACWPCRKPEHVRELLAKRKK
jgi:hypothetical protein